ncbi:MAG: M36 family metallopeptidase, partial [Acidobacteria bacterium]|nr:M36 family metallopeptidase [Acidobacteriota bacterium]
RITNHESRTTSSGPEGLAFELNPDRGSQILKSFVGDPVASPNTWVAALPNIGTSGNNAITLPLARNPEQRFNFPFGNIYNTDGASAFDLDGQTLRFTPNAAGGYDAGLLPLSLESNLGSNMTIQVRPNRDDGFFRLALSFAFPFFGTPFTSAFINSNGNVTFAAGSTDPSESLADMILASPRIAALWSDLDLTSVPEGSGLFVKAESNRVVITWNKAPEFATTNSNTVQLKLFADGVIEIAFAGVDLKTGLVGVSQGNNDFSLQPVDFSASAPLTGLSSSIAEKFPIVELDAATTNLFYHLNFMHDYLYNLGFNESAGNFQLDNFDRGGSGNDPVRGAAQHSGFNNAFFATLEDGQPAFTAYFLFTTPPLRQADSAVDADVIYHEYVHGLTTRLVGNPYDVTALSGFQGGAMGEGWSDAYACSITNDSILGEYATGNAETGIRAVNYAQSPRVYGDFGNRFGPLILFQITGGIALDKTFIPESHDDGEIWATVLWDLRTALGRETFERVITDALKFTPSRPSMLDARDAILIADVANTGGTNQTAIWTVFAARGMGVSARSENSDDTIVFQAFDTPTNRLLPGRETIFFDNMASGVNGWTVAGDAGNGAPALWRQSTRRGTAWYYGKEDTANYNTNARNFGALTSPAITLPEIPSSSALVLEFDHFLRAQDIFSITRDNGYVRVVDPATGEVTQVAYVNNNTVGTRGGESFQHEEINISRFAGRSIQIQFYFDTINQTANDAEGWYIDNVRISRRVR